MSLESQGLQNLKMGMQLIFIYFLPQRVNFYNVLIYMCSSHHNCYWFECPSFFPCDRILFHFIKAVEANYIMRNVIARSCNYMPLDSLCYWSTIFRTLLYMTKALMSEPGTFKLLLAWVPTNIAEIYFFSLNQKSI